MKNHIYHLKALKIYQGGGMQLVQEHMVLSVEIHLSDNHHHHLQLVPSVLTVFDPSYVDTTLFFSLFAEVYCIGYIPMWTREKTITFIVWKLLQCMIRVN